MNKYKELLEDFVKVKSLFEKYERSCIEVDLSLMREELPKLDVILLHNNIEKYYPDLILSSMMSHGGVDCMKLIAPRQDIIELFDFLVLHYEEKCNNVMVEVMTEFNKCIKYSSKCGFSLSKMLKQLDIYFQ